MTIFFTWVCFGIQKAKLRCLLQAQLTHFSFFCNDCTWQTVKWTHINMTSCLPFEVTVCVSYLPFRLLLCLLQYQCKPSVSLPLMYPSSLSLLVALQYIISYYMCVSNTQPLITRSPVLGELINAVFLLRLWSVTLISHLLLASVSSPTGHTHTHAEQLMRKHQQALIWMKHDHKQMTCID